MEDVSEKVLTPIPEWGKLIQEDIQYLDESKNTSFPEVHLLSKFMTYSLNVLKKYGIGLTRDIKILELYFIISDLDDLVQKQNIDREVYEYYEKLNINNETKVFFNNLSENNFNYVDFEYEISNYDLETIMTITKNIEKNYSNILCRGKEFQSYQTIIKTLSKNNYEKFEYELLFAKQLLDYYDIYLNEIEELINDTIRKIQILNSIGEIKYKEFIQY